MRRLAVLLVVAAAIQSFPLDAHAGRKVRLMFEPPLQTEGGPAVAVTFENAREENKGGTEVPLIAQERGQYGIPSGIFSGKSKTEHCDTLVPKWAAESLKGAGYDARVGDDPTLPRLHVKLTRLWGDGLGPRLEFRMEAHLSLFAPGGTEPVWQADMALESGVTTIIQFHDPYELGFVRIFQDGTKALLGMVATPEFQAALPGGNLEAAAKAAELLGNRDETVAAEQAEKPQEGSEEFQARKDAQLAGFKTWHPDVYEWGGKSTIGGYVFGGIAAGMMIAGDQLARKQIVALPADMHTGGNQVPKVGAAFVSAGHIPYSGPTEPEAGDVVQGYVYEFVFLFGVQGFVPSIAGGVPGTIAAATGADLQTVKAVVGISSLPAFLPSGIVNLDRFSKLYAPEWQLQQANDDNIRLHHVVPGVASLASGIADIAIGTIQFAAGIAYAAGAIQASPKEKGLLPMPQMQEGRMENQGTATFFVAPSPDGGVAFGLSGTF